MKFDITILFLVFYTFSVSAQNALQVTEAEVSFIFTNNDIKGTLSGFKSESNIDIDEIENSKFKGSLQVETIDTGNSIRNWSLKRSKYFDVNTYPFISFESNRITQKEETILVFGKLTIKNISKDITFLFKQNGKQLIGETSLYSYDYGIRIKGDRKKNKVLIKVALKLK